MTGSSKTKARSTARGRRPPPSRAGRIASAVTAFLAATAVIWVALINHAFGLFGLTHGSSPGAPACTGPRATVTAPLAGGPDPEILVHVNCPPAGNDSYVLIAELHNVGANPHTVYYPKVDMRHPRRGDYPYLLDLSKAQIGTSRRLYVINVDPSQDILLGQNTVIDNGLLNLPQGATIVSNQVINTRGW